MERDHENDQCVSVHLRGRHRQRLLTQADAS